MVVGGGELNEGGVKAGIHVGAELGGNVLWGAEHGAVRFGDLFHVHLVVLRLGLPDGTGLFLCVADHHPDVGGAGDLLLVATNCFAVFLEDAVKFLQCIWVAEAVPHVAIFREGEERLGAAVATDHDRHALLNGEWCVCQFAEVVVATCGGGDGVAV